MKKKFDVKYFIALSDITSFSISLIFGIITLALNVEDINAYLPLDNLLEFFTIHFSVLCLTIGWFWLKLRHYTYRKPFWFELKEMLRTLIIFAVIELAIVAFSKFYISRYLWLTVWSFTLIMLPLMRITLKKVLIKHKLYLKPTIIIGGGNNAIDAYYALNSEPYLGLDVKYFLSSHPSEQLNKLGIPVISDMVEDGIWSLVTHPQDQFIIALEDYENTERDYWLRYLSTHNYRAVSVIPSLRGLPLYSTNMSFLFSYDVMLLRLNNNLAKRSSRIIKRLTDIVLSLTALIGLSPLLIYLYWRIRQDGGKAIYGHSRIGQNGKPFLCWKFRSMVNNSEEVLQNLLENNPLAKAEWEKDFKLKNDPRITQIGHFLRKSSLDELPQLWNVLKGEMSLVGPRPVIKDELPRYCDELDYYLMAKPGMTGLWQVSGRNDVDYEKRVYFDSWYVKNWSLWNDFVILCKTINIVYKRKGAY